LNNDYFQNLTDPNAQKVNKKRAGPTKGQTRTISVGRNIADTKKKDRKFFKISNNEQRKGGKERFNVL